MTFIQATSEVINSPIGGDVVFYGVVASLGICLLGLMISVINRKLRIRIARKKLVEDNA